jgi:hypothetical protein
MKHFVHGIFLGIIFNLFFYYFNVVISKINFKNKKLLF